MTDDKQFKGPYVLMRGRDGQLRFMPARQDENGHWVALTDEEVRSAVANNNR